MSISVDKIFYVDESVLRQLINKKKSMNYRNNYGNPLSVTYYEIHKRGYLFGAVMRPCGWPSRVHEDCLYSK